MARSLTKCLRKLEYELANGLFVAMLVKSGSHNEMHRLVHGKSYGEGRLRAVRSAFQVDG